VVGQSLSSALQLAGTLAAKDVIAAARKFDWESIRAMTKFQ
jgi:hypothetical protein